MEELPHKKLASPFEEGASRDASLSRSLSATVIYAGCFYVLYDYSIQSQFPSDDMMHTAWSKDENQSLAVMKRHSLALFCATSSISHILLSGVNKSQERVL